MGSEMCIRDSSLSAPNRYQSVANNNSYRYNTVWPTPCFVWPFRSTHLRKKRGGRAGETTAVDQLLLQAYRPAGGTSCGPLVCLCYTRVAMHGRSFPSARVIVVVLPLPSVVNVFPSVEPTTIVKVRIQFAGFEQN